MQKFRSALLVLVLFVAESLRYNIIFLGSILPSNNQVARSWRLFCGGSFNLLWCLALWSYFRAAFASPGRLTEEWQQFVANNPGLQVHQNIDGPLRRWCPRMATIGSKSPTVRPERAHFCLVCNDHTLRMDHHCPLVGNCIGFNNYKYYYLTVVYIALTTVLSISTEAPELLACILSEEAAWYCSDGSSVATIFQWFLSVPILGGLLANVLATRHTWMAASNLTTLEAGYDDVIDNPYDHGSSFRNFEQVFGAFGMDWFLPIAPRRPTCDGFAFPCKGVTYDSEKLVAMVVALAPAGHAPTAIPVSPLSIPLLGQMCHYRVDSPVDVWIGSAVTWLTAMEGTRVHYRVRHRRRKKLRGSNFDPLPAAAAVVQSMEERAKQSIMPIGSGIQAYSQAPANDIATTTLLSSDTTTMLGQSRGLSALGSNDTALDNAVLSAEEFSLRLTGMSLREATVTISIVAGGLSLFGATLLAYHCYLLRLGKTTKEHWTEGRQNKSKVDLLDTSPVLDGQGSTLTGLAAPLANQVAAPQEQRPDQAKAERNGLVDRKAVANQATAPAEPVPVPTQKYARTTVPARIPMRARRRNRDQDNCSTLCGNTGPRLLDPYDRVSKQVVAASLEAARSARDKYIRHRMQLLQERYHYPRELALRRSIRDMDGTNCALCEGTCVEKACKEGIASLSRRLTIHLGFFWRAMRALSRCDARAMFRKEKALEV